jgi:hypothetical protein
LSTFYPKYPTSKSKKIPIFQSSIHQSQASSIDQSKASNIEAEPRPKAEPKKF